VSLEKTLNAVSHLGAKAVFPLWWLSLTKGRQAKQLLCWSGMTDTELSTTSGSNEALQNKLKRSERLPLNLPLLALFIVHSLDVNACDPWRINR